MPSLLREARGPYARSVRQCLSDDGFDDVPRNGAFVLAGNPHLTSAAAVQTALGATKQTASQLIDTLVLRGYLQRRPHPSDRRRTELELTERGHGAAAAIRRGVGAVDHELSHHLSTDQREALRSGLRLLADMGAGPVPTSPHPGPRLIRATPVFPVANTKRALEHYADLGFTVEPYPDGGYGFAQRDGVGIHLNRVADLPTDTNQSAVHLYVSDVDALAAEWSRPGLGGETRAPVDTDYHMREGSHLDPDHNLIRFGTALRRSPQFLASARARRVPQADGGPGTAPPNAT